MSIGPPMLGIRLFHNLTLKVQGHDHSSRSHSGFDILSTQILFVPCQLTLQLLRYSFLKFDLENPRSRSWTRSKIKVTKWVRLPTDSRPFLSMSIGHPTPGIQFFQNLTLKIQGQGHNKVTLWVQHPFDSHLFCSMSIEPPIPEMQLFQNLTLKTQGQSHGWSQSSESQSGSDFLLTHIPFVPCQSSTPLQGYSFFWFWPWKSKFKVIAQGHIVVYKHLINSHPFHSMLINPTILEIQQFKIHVWPLKSKIKVIDEVKIQSNKVYPIFYQLTSLSFHVNRSSHSWDMAFQN